MKKTLLILSCISQVIWSQELPEHVETISAEERHEEAVASGKEDQRKSQVPFPKAK